MKYQPIAGKPDLPQIQEDMLRFWRENNVFERSVHQHKENEVVFYDGPPFPTGKPHHRSPLFS